MTELTSPPGPDGGRDGLVTVRNVFFGESIPPSVTTCTAASRRRSPRTALVAGSAISRSQMARRVSTRTTYGSTPPAACGIPCRKWDPLENGRAWHRKPRACEGAVHVKGSRQQGCGAAGANASPTPRNASGLCPLPAYLSAGSGPTGPTLSGR